MELNIEQYAIQFWVQMKKMVAETMTMLKNVL